MSLELNESALTSLPPAFERPAFDRSQLEPGIIHVGPGAFFRAHQAAYADTLLAHDPRWAISAVALNSTGVANALRPQNGLYTLALLEAETRFRVIGSVFELPTAADRALIARRFGSPATRLITATVTEKGYCLGADGELDFHHPSIRADLARPGDPKSFIGWLAHGLRERREAGGGGLTVMSCDNLAGNGEKLGRAVAAFVEATDPDLARWIADHVRFPSSMVDSITPATDGTLREMVRAAGVEDAWPIQRERFAQWVIEDDFAGERPPFDSAGAEFTRSVAAWEESKLRLLNGAHSALAYIGLLLGLRTVADAMADDALATFAERLMRDDIAPTLGSAGGVDHQTYVGAVLARFRNPAIRHLLAQIAWDGSKKLPFRLLPTIEAALVAGRPVDRLVVPVAGWLRFVGLPHSPASPLVDPLSERLVELAGDLDALVERSGVFPPALVSDPAFRHALASAWARMDGPAGARAALT